MKDDTKEFFTCTLIRLIDGESVAREPDPLISMNMADAVREVLREYTNVQPGYELLIDHIRDGLTVASLKV